jgi:beta-galactosidase/beta-glucuronidase
LHFGAVDQSCKVYINGKYAGGHRGGYTPFSLEVQNLLVEGKNVIRVECTDITEDSHGARGKQSSHPGKIWYTAQSGIWQSVWMENVPTKHIKDITIKTFFDKKQLYVYSESEGKQVITVLDSGKEIIKKEFCNKEITIKYDFEPWSPKSPKLYDIVIENECGDRVESYFGMRTFSVEADENGKKRLFLNGKPCFMNGVLDQGYFSDGLLTPPSDKAMYDEIKMLKDMGFNMIRKHIKIEPMRWYYHSDRLGMIVWQDFVNGGGEYKFFHIGVMPFLGFKHKDSDYKYFSRENKEGRDEYYQAMEETVSALKNVPSIGVWVPFNEGWGQFDSFEVTKKLLSLDDTRIIDSVSGWHDQGKDKTTMLSLYTYYTPLKAPKDPRPVVLSEFGGYSMKIADHVYSEKEFGYKIFKDEESLCRALSILYLKKLLPLIKKGLSACVYTQVSDVEEEINGLITYDRAKIKVPVEFMKDINEKIYEEASKIK